MCIAPDYPAPRRQTVSVLAAASPDFSGWNWVAHRAPFSMAATNGSPCSVQVTAGGSDGTSTRNVHSRCGPAHAQPALPFFHVAQEMFQSA